jgi:hypothetical protein
MQGVTMQGVRHYAGCQALCRVSGIMPGVRHCAEAVADLVVLRGDIATLWAD